MVESFARAGAMTCYLGRRADRGKAQAAELREQGLRVEFFAGDVTKEEDLSKVIQTIADRHGRLDFAVNNAGLESEPRTLADTDLEDFTQVMETNVTGVFLSMKHEIPLLQKSNTSAIVNVASVLGKVAMPGVSPYVAAKHAVIGLSKTAALELADHGVRVNALCPGGVETDMLARTVSAMEGGMEHIAGMHPLGRLGTPYEIANSAMWLCSEAASFVTGQAICVDGGFTTQ